MSSACKCDKCGKFYERTKDFNDRKYRICGQRNNLEMDICNDCYAELLGWIDGRINLRDCIHCKYSKNGKVNCNETCHLCMWENQFEREIEVCCGTCEYLDVVHDHLPCSECTDYSLWEGQK